MKKKVRNPKVGDLVQVPVYEFAPFRTGWNGWIFRVGVIERIYVGRKSGRKIARVRYASKLHDRYGLECDEHSKDFYIDNVFLYDHIAIDLKNYVELLEAQNQGERVCWSEDTAFLVKNGYFTNGSTR